MFTLWQTSEDSRGARSGVREDMPTESKTAGAQSPVNPYKIREQKNICNFFKKGIAINMICDILIVTKAKVNSKNSNGGQDNDILKALYRR